MPKEKYQPESDNTSEKGSTAPVVSDTESTKPLKVEIFFPTINDLKQSIGFDSDSNLVAAIQFKIKVDQFELFRLINLLKQPHSSLYAIIGSNQSAMDFKFTQQGKIEILKAELAQEKAKAQPSGGKSTGKGDNPGSFEKPVDPVENEFTFKDVSFNHVPEESLPYGVVIDFTNGESDKTHTVAGRGKTYVEAVIVGLHQTKAVLFDGVTQPFKILEALKKTPATDAQIKIVRSIEVGTFDMDEGKDHKKDEDNPKGT